MQNRRILTRGELGARSWWGPPFALEPANMLKARNIGAYRELLVLFTRYGLKDFHLSFEPEDVLLADEGETAIEPDVKQRADAFAAALKKMGPTYVKFGQVLS